MTAARCEGSVSPWGEREKIKVMHRAPVAASCGRCSFSRGSSLLETAGRHEGSVSPWGERENNSDVLGLRWCLWFAECDGGADVFF